MENHIVLEDHLAKIGYSRERVTRRLDRILEGMSGSDLIEKFRGVYSIVNFGLEVGLNNPKSSFPPTFGLDMVQANGLFHLGKRFGANFLEDKNGFFTQEFSQYFLSYIAAYCGEDPKGFIYSYGERELS